MKKLLLSLLVLPFLFAGCSSDDDNDNNYSAEQLVGTWLFTKTFAQEIKTSNTEVTQIIKDIIETDYGDSNDEKIIFSADGTVYVKSDEEGSDDLYGSYTVKGNIISMKLSRVDGLYQGTTEAKIVLSNDVLTFYYDATDEYVEEFNHYPYNKYEAVINSVISADSYKRVN